MYKAKISVTGPCTKKKLSPEKAVRTVMNGRVDEREDHCSEYLR